MLFRSVLVVIPSLPVKSLAELTAMAKASPTKLNYATNGTGSSSHLATLLYESMAGVKMTHIPYKGLSPALSDMLGGQVQLMFNSIVALVPQVKAGKVRAIAVTSKNRSSLLPDVPTLAETLPGYEAGSWYGILVPAGTPREVVNTLNAAMLKSLATPEVADRLNALASPPSGGTPEAFGALIRAEVEKWAKVIRAGNVKVD